jgi:hypothetical protein
LTRTAALCCAGLPDFLTRVAQEEMKRVPPEMCHGARSGDDDAGSSHGVVLSICYIPKVQRLSQAA